MDSIIQKLKGSAKMECKTDTFDLYDTYEDNKEKYKNIYVTITAKTKEMASKIFDELEDKISYQFCRCPQIDQIDDNKWIYCDTAVVEFEYGFMEEYLKDFKDQFRQAKRELGIR